MSALTPEDLAELRAAASKADAAYAAWLDDQVPAKWRAYYDALEILRQVDSDEILALLDEIDAQAARIAELERQATPPTSQELRDRAQGRRGRCSKHKDEPGPSLYFDCCESERLRGLVRHRDERIAELERELDALWADFEKYAGHDKDCDSLPDVEPCTCGLTEARRRWAGEKK